MIREINENKTYAVEGYALGMIMKVMKSLYAPNKLTADERRDLANILHNFLYCQIIEINEE
jgi:hypothetical protein